MKLHQQAGIEATKSCMSEQQGIADRSACTHAFMGSAALLMQATAQVEVARVQSRFSYLRQGWGARETAADMVVTRMCQRWAEMNKKPENPFDLFEKDVREMDAGSIDGAILFNEPKVHI